MSFCLPSLSGLTFVSAERGRINGSLAGLSHGIFRFPTDPLFFAALTLDNIVVGSRYRVTRNATGEELALGVAGTTSVVLSGLPVYVNPMRVDITIRNASGSPAYKIFDTSAFMGRDGATAFILQQLDE